MQCFAHTSRKPEPLTFKTQSTRDCGPNLYNSWNLFLESYQKGKHPSMIKDTENLYACAYGRH